MKPIHVCIAIAAMTPLMACGGRGDDAQPRASADSVLRADTTAAAAPAPAAIPAEFPVRRDGSLSGFGNTEVAFPADSVETMPRIVEDDGGYLDLARSTDGRVVWVRRWWDDGSTDVNRFEMENRPGERFLLQFVDGEVVPRDSSVAGEMGIRTFREGDRWFEQLLRAWVIDRDTDRIRRPDSGEWYPLVRAPGTPADVVPERLQWMVFVGSCSETGSPCVYYGTPAEVCARYFDQTTPQAGQALWIAPKDRCGKHW